VQILALVLLFVLLGAALIIVPTIPARRERRARHKRDERAELARLRATGWIS
jgi:ABC-type transport system involved in cytochrome bd biosynthesis fused ATPase/permease subunit